MTPSQFDPGSTSVRHKKLWTSPFYSSMNGPDLKTLHTVAKFYSTLGKSEDTKHKISCGTSSIQTNTRKENLTLWAKAWATELPCIREKLGL